MTQRRFATAMLAAAASLGVFTATSQAQKAAPKAAASAQNVPAEYQAGIAQLRAAKGALEKAGDKWGGYRAKAIQTIDQAFVVLGVNPESTPTELQSGNVDQPALMNRGIAGLESAKADFAKAGNDWGGRKEKAVALVNQALQELQQGIAWAKQHKTY